MKSVTLNSNEVVRKIAYVGLIIAVAILFALLMSHNVYCDNLFDNDGSASVTAFDTIGKVYFKFAWFFGAAGAVGWFVKKSDEKKSAVFKTIVIGIIAGYIIFALGGAFWQSTFQTIASWFGDGGT